MLQLVLFGRDDERKQLFSAHLVRNFFILVFENLLLVGHRDQLRSGIFDQGLESGNVAAHI